MTQQAQSVMGFVLLAFASACTPVKVQVRATGDGTTRLECGRDKLRVHFFDVGQGLAALVELPTGQLVLVDTGESSTRPGCGGVCRQWNERFLRSLHTAVGERAIDVIWLTHPHSDHIGGAVDVMDQFKVRVLVHNGVGGSSATSGKVLAAAAAHQVEVRVATKSILDDITSGESLLRLTGILPSSLGSCGRDVNNCSVGLRVAYCESSVLFVGDAEAEEEGEFEGVEGADVLQVGHHGSDTSSTLEFVKRVKPSWAVVSSGHPDEGTNRTYCHPRLAALQRLGSVLPAGENSKVRAFSGSDCKGSAGGAGWNDDRDRAY